MSSGIRFRSLHLADLLLLPGAVRALAAARLVLRNLAPSTVHSLNRRASEGSWAACADPGTVERVSRVVPAAAGRVPWRSDCLVQAIAAQDMLARRGIPGRIVIGVDRAGGQFESHAWLEVNGAIVLGGSIERYTVLLDYAD